MGSRYRIPRRPAFTLVELVVSLAVAGVLLVGLGSAIVLAAQALPASDRPVDRIVAQRGVLDQLTSELASADYLVETTGTALTYILADRDADGLPERVRYAWSGTAGDSLTRQLNGGTAQVVLEDVEAFALDYSQHQGTRTFTGVPVESSETLLAGQTTATTLYSVTVRSTLWPGQYFQPTLTGDAIAWRITRARLRARKKGTVDQVCAVQLRAAGTGTVPTDQVLDEYTLNESTLPAETSSFTWRDIPFTACPRLRPDECLCLAITATAADAAQLQYRAVSASTNQAYLQGNSSGWSSYPDYALMAAMYGTVYTRGADETATWSYWSGVQIDVATAEHERVSSAARLVNLPPVVTHCWQADFSSDPTEVDLWRDGSDWVMDTGSSFSDDRLSGGVWLANQTLNSEPALACSELTTAELRFCDSSADSEGPTLRLHVDAGGGQYGYLEATLANYTPGGQTLTLRSKSGASPVVLTSVPGLPDGFVTLRLIIDPASDIVNLAVDEQDYGTFPYSFISGTGLPNVQLVPEIGTGAEFDHVRVWVGGTL